MLQNVNQLKLLTLFKACVSHLMDFCWTVWENCCILFNSLVSTPVI